MQIPEDIMKLVRERLSPSTHGFLGISETVTVRKFASEEDYKADRPIKEQEDR